MSKAIRGNSDLAHEVVQRFVMARDAVGVVVADVLVSETARHLGQDDLDSIETALLETRVQIDSALLALPRLRTIRMRQAVGGVAGSINKRLADLERAVATLRSGSKAESTEPQDRPMPAPDKAEVGADPAEEAASRQ